MLDSSITAVVAVIERRDGEIRQGQRKRVFSLSEVAVAVGI
jgi:hypothetical protein